MTCTRCNDTGKECEGRTCRACAGLPTTDVMFSIEIDQEVPVTLEFEASFVGCPDSGFTLHAATLTEAAVWLLDDQAEEPAMLFSDRTPWLRKYLAENDDLRVQVRQTRWDGERFVTRTVVVPLMDHVREVYERDCELAAESHAERKGSDHART